MPPAKPHKITIWMSSIALAVSLLSLCLAWKALNLNETVSRAVVQPVSLALRADWKWKPEQGATQDPLKIEMVLDNSGKTVATGIQVQFWFNLCNQSRQVDNGSGEYPDKKCSATVTTLNRMDDLGPGPPRSVQLDLDVTAHSSPPGQPLWSPGLVTNLTVSPNFYYSDAIGKYQYQPCFEAYAAENGIFEKGQLHPCVPFDRRPVSPN
jgi:hypothetical protein